MARGAGSFPSNSKKSPSPPLARRANLSKKNQQKSRKFNSFYGKIVACLLVPCLLAFVGHYLYQNYIFLPNVVRTKSDLGRILPENWYGEERNRDMFWGTYRSQLYFGLKTRENNSPVFGLMWYRQPAEDNIVMPRIRHWCDQSDGIEKYGWLRHDGRNFGVQEIVDGELAIHTSFIKRGQDWSARIQATPKEPLSNESTITLHSYILYFALGSEDTDGTFLRPHLSGEKYAESIDYVDGYTPKLGAFRISFTNGKNFVAKSFLVARKEPKPDLTSVKEWIMSGTGVIKLPKSKYVHHVLGLAGFMANGEEKPNMLAVQLTFVKTGSVDVVFESNSAQNRQNNLYGHSFDALLEENVQNFEKKFEQIFGLSKLNYPQIYMDMGYAALSNMLGSIGYFYGSSRVISKFNSKPRLYGPMSLFTTVPSRPFFPRGFLWDEGFHHLLVSKFDADLSLEIIASWLDAMNIEGWIPREMILGAEAEMKVPQEFIIQDNSVANPPMFFYLISAFLKSENREFLKKMYPRLKLWYGWLNSCQAGAIPGTYRWRGRNSTTQLELNPKTLPSGLDDYPRASHPTDEEYHVDLYCWMALSSKTMAQLAKLVDDNSEEAKKYAETVEFLYDEKRLNDLHWSEKSARYADYGLHTRNVKLERAKPIVGPNGVPRQSNIFHRTVQREPKYRLVADTFGYVSLYPMLLRIIEPNSPKLAKILDQLMDVQLLWSPYGLRSLSPSSPLYEQRNMEQDPPYWRGSVWLNMNYLALSSLHYYGSQSGGQQDKCKQIYSKLRENLVQNVAREFRRTGYIWEHYSDQTGHGKGSHPHTGWTSLVLLIMAESYE